jgi:hypothetical protein
VARSPVLRTWSANGRSSLPQHIPSIAEHDLVPNAATLEAEIEALIRKAGSSLRQSSMDATQAIPASNRGPRPQSLPVDQIGITVPEAGFAWDHEIRIRSRNEVLAATAPPGARRFRRALITGALVTALGLGWIGGSNLHDLVVTDPSPPPFNVSVGAIDSDTGTIASTPKMGREVTPGEPNAWKAATVSATKLDRGDRPSPAAAHQPIQSTNPISSAAQQINSSPRPAASAADRRGKILPTAETKPTTIQGWVVRDVVGGTAVLEGPTGVWKVTRGDMVPELGRVDFLVRWGSRWIVGTSRGLITTP